MPVKSRYPVVCIHKQVILIVEVWPAINLSLVDHANKVRPVLDNQPTPLFK